MEELSAPSTIVTMADTPLFSLNVVTVDDASILIAYMVTITSINADHYMVTYTLKERGLFHQAGCYYDSIVKTSYHESLHSAHSMAYSFTKEIKIAVDQVYEMRTTRLPTAEELDNFDISDSSKAINIDVFAFDDIDDNGIIASLTIQQQQFCVIRALANILINKTIRDLKACMKMLEKLLIGADSTGTDSTGTDSIGASL